mgnify:CR=1 FL=1
MITRKFDRNIEVLRNRFADADAFIAQYHSNFVDASAHYGDYIISVRVGEYDDGRTYYLCRTGEAGKTTGTEYPSFDALLAAFDPPEAV